VIQPAPGLPCYVFQSSSRWPDSKLAKEVAEMFSATDEACSQCGSNHYLWISSKGAKSVNSCAGLIKWAVRDTFTVGKSSPRVAMQ
jgi:hypothetical protein